MPSDLTEFDLRNIDECGETIDGHNLIHNPVVRSLCGVVAKLMERVEELERRLADDD